MQLYTAGTWSRPTNSSGICRTGRRFLVSAELAGGKPAQAEGDHTDEQLYPAEAGPVGVQQDCHGTGHDQANDRPVRLSRPPVHDPFDELRHREDPHHDSQTAGNEGAARRQEFSHVEVDETGHKLIDQVQDRLIVAQEHEHHAARDPGDHHRRRGNDSHQKQQDHVHWRDSHTGLGSAVFAQERHADHQGEEEQEADRHARVEALVTDFVQDERQAPGNQAAEPEVGRDRPCAQEVFEELCQQHQRQSGPDEDRQQEPDRFFPVPEQVGDGFDESVIQPHGHQHGSAGYTWNDVGDAHHHALEDSFQHSCIVLLISFVPRDYIRWLPDSGSEIRIGTKFRSFY